MAARMFDRSVKGNVLAAQTRAVLAPVAATSLLSMAVQAVATGAKHQVFHRRSSAVKAIERTETAPVSVIG
jgi:hypothetical protein